MATDDDGGTDELLDWYEREFVQPTSEQIVAEAIGKLKRDIAALRSRAATREDER
jgi:hypothetical protein